MIKRLLALVRRYKKFIKFCVIGLLGAAIDFGLLAVLVELFQWSPLAANIVSFSAAVINNFWLNKLWTWRNQDPDYHRQFVKFTSTSLVGLLINTWLMWLLLLAGIHYLLAKVFISIVVAFWNFSVNNFWTFKERRLE